MSVTTRGTLTLRMMRTRPGASLLVAALSFVLAAIVAAVPVGLTAAADASARHALASLSPGARDLQAAAAGVPQTGTSTGPPWARWEQRLNALPKEAGDPLASLLGAPASVTRLSLGQGAPGIAIPGGDGENRLELALAPHVDERATLTAGRWPEAAPPWTDGSDRRPAVEVALSTETARLLDWPVGAELESPFGWLMTLTGTFDAADGSADYWYHVPSSLVPRQEFEAGTGDRIITGLGVLAPDMLAYFQGVTATTDVWLPLDPSGMDAGDAAELLRQLRTLTADAHRMGSQSDGLGGVLSLTFRTSTIEVLDEAVSASSAMRAVVALTLSAPAGVAVAVTVLACRVVARSRRAGLALLATRGASPRALRAMLAAHGAAFGILPALLGAGVVAAAALAARLAVPVEVVPPVAVAALLPALVLASSSPPAAGLREQTRAPSALRRALVEGVVIAAAVLATAALVTQALSGQRLGSLGQSGSAGVLAAAVPLLWGLVGCVVALRLVPLLVRVLFARARRGTGLVGFVGAARTLREGAAGIAPALALVIGMASAVGSGVLFGSMQHDLDRTAQRTVGADLQVARAALDDTAVAALRGIDGVAAVAPISTVGAVYLKAGTGAGVDTVTVTVLFADPDELRAAQGDVAPLLPADADIGGGGAGEPPLVVSARASAAIEGRTEATLDGTRVTVAAVSQAAAPESVAPNWVLVDEALADELFPRRAVAETVALVSLAPGADAGAVARAVRDLVGPDAAILSPSVIVDGLSSRPGTFAVRTALLGATVAVAALSALAVTLTLTLGSRTRERILALLRMLGAPARTGRGLVAWELAPPLAAALVVGAGIGLALPALLLETVDLRAFTGSGAAPAYHLDPLLLAAAVGGFLLLTALLTALALALSRRARLAVLLRAGQEG